MVKTVYDLEAGQVVRYDDNKYAMVYEANGDKFFITHTDKYLRFDKCDNMTILSDKRRYEIQEVIMFSAAPIGDRVSEAVIYIHNKRFNTRCNNTKPVSIWTRENPEVTALKKQLPILEDKMNAVLDEMRCIERRIAYLTK